MGSLVVSPTGAAMRMTSPMGALGGVMSPMGASPMGWEMPTGYGTERGLLLRPAREGTPSKQNSKLSQKSGPKTLRFSRTV